MLFSEVKYKIIFQTFQLYNLIHYDSLSGIKYHKIRALMRLSDWIKTKTGALERLSVSALL